jgi:hypothetical protein
LDNSTLIAEDFKSVEGAGSKGLGRPACKVHFRLIAQIDGAAAATPVIKVGWTIGQAPIDWSTRSSRLNKRER